MTRVEHLRARSLQAQVAYVRNLERATTSSANERQCRNNLQQREARFWGEVTLAKTPGTQEDRSHTITATKRLWEESRVLEGAKTGHAAAKAQLESELRSLVTARSQSEQVLKLLAKARREHAHKLETRLSEELGELAVALRARSKHSASAGAKLGRNQAPGGARLESSEPRRAQFSELRECTPQLTAPTHGLRPEAISTQTKVSALPVGGPSAVDVHDVTTHCDGQRSTLSLSCSLPGKGSIGLSLVRDSNGAIGVSVDPRASALGLSISRERTALLSRLQGLGIKISSIEVAADDAPSSSLSAGRKRQHREQDEELVA